MTKIQKTWLWVFAAMFVVPEVLWSPVGNLISDILQNSNNVIILRPNFLTNSDNTNYLLFFLGIQLIGIVGTLFLTWKIKSNPWVKSILILIILSLAIITGFVFYFAFSLRNGIGF